MGTRTTTILALVFTLLAATGGVAAGERGMKIKLATLAPKGSIYHRSLQEMGQAWREAQGGRSRFIIYTDGTQGGEADVVRRMRIGQIDAALLTAVGLSELDLAVRALQYMPMMFRSWEEVDHVGGVLRPELERGLYEKGFVVLFWAEAGWVQFFSKEPAVHPADFERLKVFAWTGDVEQVEIMASMGYRPVVLETSDILPSLQTGLIDAAAVTPFYALISQIDGPARHMLALHWAPIVGAAVIRRDTWDAMRPEARARLREAAAAAELRLRAHRDEAEARAIQTMVGRGLQVHALNAALKREWRETAESTYPDIRGRMVPAPMFDRVRQELEHYRRENGSGS